MPDQSVLQVSPTRERWLLVGKPEALAAVHGLAPNTSAEVPGLGRVLWLGPEHWLAFQGPSFPPSRERRTEWPPGVVTLPAGARFVEIVIDGPGARDLLAVGCSLDLREPSFTVGACAGTRIDTVPVTLLREAADRFVVLVERPLFDYLQRWLQQAAAASAAQGEE